MTERLRTAKSGRFGWTVAITYLFTLNPVVDGKLTIGPSGASSYRIEVNNLAGTRVLQLRLANQRQLDVRGLARGMYILRIISDSGETQTGTFFVK